MSQNFDLILKSGTVVNQDGEGVRDIAISNGRIAAIGTFAARSAGEVIDCKGLHILPGRLAQLGQDAARMQLARDAAPSSRSEFIELAR